MAKHITVFKLMLLFILNVVFVRGVNITEFDDGGSLFNITSNYTGFITIPVNSTITEANITIKGFLGDNKQWCSQDNARTTNCTGQTVGNYSVHNMNSNGTVLYINYSKPTSATNESIFEITHGNLATYNNSIPAGCWNYSDNSLLFRGFSSYWLNAGSTPNGTSYFECLNSTGWASIGNTELLSNNVGTTGGEGAAQNESYDDNYITYYFGRLTPSISLISNCASSSACSASRLIEEAMHWYNVYTKDVLIKTNGTIMFNHTGNLTGTNSSISLNKTLIQNYVVQQQTIQVNFTASQFGKLEISNLILTYNKTNSAVLSILSPAQITKSIASGTSFTQAINLSNTGNWNATNISFEAISQSATANLNDSITHDCSSINLTTETSIICNVTFSSLTQSAESDEKLRVKSLGTDNNDIIYSDSIDLDVTIATPSPAVPEGGAGGGIIKRIETFIIVVRNFFAKETKQLGIKPASEREYCLDLISQNTTKAQTIKLSCSNPTFDEKKPCSWIEFDKNPITLSPSTEQRMPVCLQITTPNNILLGEQYVIVISGSSDQENTEIQRHTITMFVTDYSEFLKNYIAIFKDDSLLKFHYTFIRENLKSDIQELGFSIPNFIFPIILLNVLLLYLVLTQFTAKPTLKVAFSVIFYLTAGVTGMFLPAIMYLSTIILFGTYFFTKIT